MNVLYQRELLPVVSVLVRKPYLVCHLDFIAECACLIKNREGAICVIESLWETAPAEKLALALTPIVKADAPRLHFGLLNPMLSLTTRGNAVGRALMPAMVGLVIALGDPGVEALQAIAIAFSAIVDPPTDDKALCRLEAWVAPIFRDSQPHSMFHPFFESLFRALWPVLDGLWESDRPLMQQSLSSLVEAVFPWVFLSTKDLWEWIVRALEICPMPDHAFVVRHCISELLEFQNKNVWMHLHGVSRAGTPLPDQSQCILALREIVNTAPVLAPFCDKDAILEALRRNPSLLPDCAMILTATLPDDPDDSCFLLTAVIARGFHPQMFRICDSIDQWAQRAGNAILAMAEAVVARTGNRIAIASRMHKARLPTDWCRSFARGDVQNQLLVKWFTAVGRTIMVPCAGKAQLDIKE
jgi:hypothetical protein